MWVQKAEPLPVECVVRGYLAGSGWKEYQTRGSVCDIPLPGGLLQAQQLPETLFTPSTKAVSGHDENIGWEECVRLVGSRVAEEVRSHSVRLYEAGRAWAATKGILIADTKFEFGLLNGRVILIDECLTPDSSRFWPAGGYAPGMSPPSFDKQFVRDYLETLAWDKTPPPPPSPARSSRAPAQSIWRPLNGSPAPRYAEKTASTHAAWKPPSRISSSIWRPSAAFRTTTSFPQGSRWRRLRFG
jgi:phosphoribosylaminoimidazole-succinocarboxamide synthase